MHIIICILYTNDTVKTFIPVQLICKIETEVTQKLKIKIHNWYLTAIEFRTNQPNVGIFDLFYFNQNINQLFNYYQYLIMTYFVQITNTIYHNTVLVNRPTISDPNLFVKTILFTVPTYFNKYFKCFMVIADFKCRATY